MAFQSPSSASPFAAQPGRNTHFFQPPPPKSPSSTVTTPSFATATDYFSTASRKRHRPDSSHAADTRPNWEVTPSWVQCPTPSDGSYTSSGYGQNSLLVNERYNLAGGFDTPSLQATAEMEKMQLGSSIDERRWRGDTHLSHTAATPLSGPLARERNGIARLHSSPNGVQHSSWTGLAFTLVGKVFSFSSTVLRGFYAGGGTGYDLHHKSRSSPLGAVNPWQRAVPCHTPLPGSWQEDEFLGDFEQDNPQSPPPSTRPPNKRRQTGEGSWVLVGTPNEEEAPELSPRRKPTTSTHVRPSLASRASSRRSLAPLPRRQSSYHTTTYSTGSPAPPPQQHQHIHTASSPTRRASIAPVRSSNSRPSSSSGTAAVTNNVYITPEAERILRKRAKQDQKADAAMSDISRRLAELTRQAQEALGTKVSVEDEWGGGGAMDDEGFVDDDI